MPEGAVQLTVADDAAEIVVVDDVDLASEDLLVAVLLEALQRGARRVVFDFCRSSFVGGPAVRIALTALGELSDRGGSVVVRGGAHVLRLFRLTGVDDHVELVACETTVGRRAVSPRS